MLISANVWIWSLTVNIIEALQSQMIHLSYHDDKNKPKMAYSRDLPKMARQQYGIMD